MLLNVSHVSKAYGENVILKDVCFYVDEGVKCAIVGNNGCGKSTLLKIIMNEISADSGEVFFGKDSTVGYLAQYQDDAYSDSILENVLSARNDLIQMESKIFDMEARMSEISHDELDAFMANYNVLHEKFDRMGGYTFRSEAVGVLKGLGFEEKDFEKKVSQLSGGQKTRVALGRLLVSSPDLLILDEPINHLDLNSIMWLEGYLANYKGAVIIVAHDRYFLDKIAGQVVDLSHKTCTTYKGNYTAFVKQKEERELTYQRSYEKQQATIEHEMEVIEKLRSFNREKSIKRAESRVKVLEKMDVMDAPLGEDDKMKLTLEIKNFSGKDVLDFNGVTKHYGDKLIFEDLSFDVHRGEKIAIIGDNGCGKTTILKCINGFTDYEAGTISIGSNVDVGYYDQEQQGLDESKSVFDEFSDTYPDMTQTVIRNTLAAFLFKGDDVFKQISSLSGGEKSRLSLAKLMHKKSNFLILDEPTNHLDMETKEILEQAISEFEGTLLYVSHDRYFVNRTADIILEMKDGKLTKYLGNYDEYMAKKLMLGNYSIDIQDSPYPVKAGASTGNGDALMASTMSASQLGGLSSMQPAATASKLDYQQQKALASEKRKVENQLKKVEDEISKLEDESKSIDEKFLDPVIAGNSVELNKLTDRQNEIQNNLEELYEKWEELSSNELLNS